MDLRRKQFHVLIAAIHELENILDGKTVLNTMFKELVCVLYINRSKYNGEKNNIKMHFVVEKDHQDSEHRISDKRDKIMLRSSVPGPKKKWGYA